VKNCVSHSLPLLIPRSSWGSAHRTKHGSKEGKESWWWCEYDAREVPVLGREKEELGNGVRNRNGKSWENTSEKCRQWPTYVERVRKVYC